ncbi:hypothetical protein NL676_028711 [Syzygium grande]|nr:hypothetical protein NL676_028711 [Syzygium grande]
MFSFNVSPLLSFTTSLTSITLVLFISFLTLKCLRPLFSAAATTNLRLPPSPRKLPIIGNLHQLGNYPHRSLQALSRCYGPLMLLHFGSAPVLVVSSADCARDIMKTHDLIFSDRPRSKLSERLLYHRKDMSLAPYGEYWRQMRSICMLQLLSNKRVHSFRTVREEEISLLMGKIEQRRSVDLSNMFAALTNDIICRVALGRKYSDGKQGNKFKGLLTDLTGLLGIFNVGDFIPSLGWINKVSGLEAKVERVARVFDEFLQEVVEEHRRKMEDKSIGRDGGEDRRDFVDVLVEIEKDKTAGFALGADSIKALILDFELIPFGAGRRGCPGISFAMATNELVLANLANKFDWAPPEGLKPEDLDMTECTGLTIHRKVHLLAVATPFPS